jgi:hypothetical protein
VKEKRLRLSAGGLYSRSRDLSFPTIPNRGTNAAPSTIIIAELRTSVKIDVFAGGLYGLSMVFPPLTAPAGFPSLPAGAGGGGR